MDIDAKREIPHGGWLPYLEKLGIDKSTASNWMALAGYADAQSQIPSTPDVRNLPDAPTLADAGIDRRPRKRDERSRTDG